MKIEPGDYVGKITGIGTDTTQSGLAYVFVTVRLPVQDEPVLCRIFLEGKSEEKTETAVRMARQTLRLCGFDVDARPISDLDDAPECVIGNDVPVRVTENESNGKWYTNYDIALPRGVSKEAAKSLTDRLRAAKSKGEAPLPPRAPLPPVVPQAFSDADIARARAAGVKPATDLSDIPF